MILPCWLDFAIHFRFFEYHLKCFYGIPISFYSGIHILQRPTKDQRTTTKLRFFHEHYYTVLMCLLLYIFISRRIINHVWAYCNSSQDRQSILWDYSIIVHMNFFFHSCFKKFKNCSDVQCFLDFCLTINYSLALFQ